MHETLVARDDTLNQLVELRNRYKEIRNLQSDRLDAIGIDSVPDQLAVDVEKAVMASEAWVIEEFVRLVSAFPEYAGSAVQTVSTSQKQSWFGVRRSVEVLVEAENPEAIEAKLQNSRLAHIVSAFVEELSERRASLQHASYSVKRVVVGLNQSAALSISPDSTRKIERERHGLEMLVSLVERTISEVVVSTRRIGMLADSLTNKVSEPSPSTQLILAD